MPDPDKRQLRNLKRTIKRIGGKRRRQQLKRDLAANPEEAQHSAFDFRGVSSETLNGLDRESDRKRRRAEE